MDITEDDVAILFVGLNLLTDFIVANPFTNTNPIALHMSSIIHKPRLLIRRIDKTKYSLSLTAVGHNGISTLFSLYFIDNVRIAITEIEFFKRLLPLLYAQSHLISIIEKQQSSQNSTFTYTLSPCKMDISVQLDLCVWDVSRVQEYDFI